MGKKTLAILLAATFALSFSACGSSDTATTSDTETAAISQEVSASDESASTTEADTEAVSAETSSSKDIYTMGETVIAEGDGVKATVTGIEDDRSWGFTLTVRLDNETEKNLMFSMDQVSVNGYMCDPCWACEVAAGKSANSDITLYAETLEACNITSVDDIEFIFNVYNSDDWDEAAIISDVYHLYPTEKSAEEIVIPERNVVDGEQIVDETDSYAFIIQSVEPDGLWGYTLHCYLENKTENALLFSWDNVSVNNMMCDPCWGATVSAGKREYTDISFYSSSLEESGISAEEISTIEYTLKVYNDDDWSLDPLCEKTFTYSPAQ